MWVLASEERLLSQPLTKGSDSGSAGIMSCGKFMMLLQSNMMLLVAEMLACLVSMVRALLLDTLALLATRLSSSSKSEYHLCTNMKNLLLQMCNNLLAYARACAMEVHAAKAARELCKELARAHRLRGLPTGQALVSGGPESAAGIAAAKRGTAIPGPKEVFHTHGVVSWRD